MAPLSVTATARVWRIQGDLFPDQPASVQAFIVNDLIDADGARIGKGADATVARIIDDAEAAKTITTAGKTYTRGEILNAVAALALAWKAEDAAAAAAAEQGA